MCSFLKHFEVGEHLFFSTIGGVVVSLTRVQLLLVEDTPEDVRHFTNVVGSAAAISVAGSGAEAVDRLFRRGRFHAEPYPDLVVMDLNVPLLNGHEVLNVVRANSETRHLPVIVYSVSDNPNDIMKAYELGACAYMVKPMDINDTQSQLEAFVQFWLKNVRYGSYPGTKSA